MQKIFILWKFSRPHTIIGSSISIVCLFLFAAFTLQKDLYIADVMVWVITLVAALGCNLFITGLNQITDIDIDRINKPQLPLASGSMTTAEAKKWVLLALAISLSLSYFLSTFYGILISLICFLGWSYSSPPIRFKRYHIWAASAIALVRGPLVNVGIALHFLHALDRGVLFNSSTLSSYLSTVTSFRVGVWMLPLTVFITAFSLGIAWFKDLPDTDGDEHHRVGTLAVNHGKSLAFRLGFTTVSMAYIFLIFWGMYFSWGIPFTAFHIGALCIFSWWSFRLNLDDKSSLKRYYKGYWLLFFLEYFSFFLIYFR